MTVVACTDSAPKSSILSISTTRGTSIAVERFRPRKDALIEFYCAAAASAPPSSPLPNHIWRVGFPIDVLDLLSTCEIRLRLPFLRSFLHQESARGL